MAEFKLIPLEDDRKKKEFKLIPFPETAGVDVPVGGAGPIEDARNFAAGALEGIGFIAGLPASGINFLLESFTDDLVEFGLVEKNPFTGDPLLGVNNIQSMLKSGGMTDVEAKTATQRIMRQAGQEVGSTLLPLGKIIQASGRVKALANVAQRPAGFAASELTSATTGGLAAGGVREGVAQSNLPENVKAAVSPTLEAFGGIAGSIAPNILSAAGRGLRNRGVDIGARAGIEKAKDRARQAGQEAAEDILQRDVLRPDLAQERIREAAALSQEFPGFNPRTASTVDEPAITAIEKVVTAENPQLLAELQNRDIANNRILRDELEKTAPRKVGVEQGRRATFARMERVSEAINKRLEAVQNEIDNLVDAGRIDRNQANTLAKQHLVEAETAFTTEKNRLYGVVDPGGVARYSPQKIKSAVTTVEGRGGRLAAKDNKPNAVIADIKAFEGEMTYNDLNDLRTRINQEWQRQEVLDAPNRALQANLSDLRTSVEKTINDIDANAFPDVAERLNQANAFFSSNAPTFREGPVRKILRARATPESATLSTVFFSGKGSPEAVRQFIKAVGRERAEPLLRAHVLEQLYPAASGVDGTLNAARHKQFLVRHRQALAEIPSVRRDIEKLADAQTAVNQLLVGEKRSREAVTRSAVKLYLGDDVRGEVSKLLKSPNKAAEARLLIRQAKGQPEAQEGLRRLLWDDFTNGIDVAKSSLAGSDPFLDPVAMRKFIREQRDVFKAFGYSDEAIAGLNRLADAAELVSRVPVPNRVNVRLKSGLELKDIIDMPSTAVQSRLFAARSGRTSTTFVGAEIFTRTLNKFFGDLGTKQLNKVLNEMLVNPEFAKDMMTRVRATKAGEAQINRIRLHLLTRGIISFEKEEDEPLPQVLN